MIAGKNRLQDEIASLKKCGMRIYLRCRNGTDIWREKNIEVLRLHQLERSERDVDVFSKIRPVENRRRQSLFSRERNANN